MLFNSLNLLYTKIRKGGRSEMELADIKGLGPKKILLFHKLGIETIEDLITNYPYQYRIWKRSDMKKVKDGNRSHRNGMRGFVRCSTMLKGTRRKIFYLECGFGV